MMGAPPSEAKALSLWEYEALIFHWNDAHSTGEDHDPPANRDLMEKLIDRINADPPLHGARKKAPVLS